MPRDIKRELIPSRDGDDERHAVTAHEVTGDGMLGGTANPLTPKPQNPKTPKPQNPFIHDIGMIYIYNY
jgi:hypothetical protein